MGAVSSVGLPRPPPLPPNRSLEEGMFFFDYEDPPPGASPQVVEMFRMRREMTHPYLGLLSKSLGFDPSGLPAHLRDMPAVVLEGADVTGIHERMCALVAVAELSRIKSANMELVEVLRADFYPGMLAVMDKTIYYITFTARDRSSADPPQAYQATIFYKQGPTPLTSGASLTFIRVRPN
ncbi:hypothetical protein Tsubulata_043644 [Turnera subulata]|uniref:Cystatin domain-containing protein n=1 Tax=Turnera subulata TaxID=218843 RepID=A0A9Q0J6H5_9ROSI|nr:hypothetical protein Tsubulata_043644 [Turnera subulata]